MRYHLRPETRHTPGEPTLVTATPLWEPIETDPDPDPDLAEATQDDPSLAAWMEALASLSVATMSDNLEEQLYSQAPDALTRQGIAPSPEAIEDWVSRHLRLNLHADS